MQLHLLLSLLLSTPTHAADLTFSLPPTPNLPTYNPASLPSTTKSTLYRHAHTVSVPLTRRNTFEFRNLSQGSWLFTVQCRDYTFEPLRVDIFAATNSSDGAANVAPEKEKIDVFQTFWGNEWGNKGEWRGGGVVEPAGAAADENAATSTGVANAAVVVPVTPLSPKDYYLSRPGFSPLQFLKSPMILMALFSLVMIVGIPYITENMDEETRAEFEEMQRKSPVAQATSGATGLQNFDLAGWMAGKSTGSGGTPRSGTPTAGER